MLPYFAEDCPVWFKLDLFAVRRSGASMFQFVRGVALVAAMFTAIGIGPVFFQEMVTVEK